MAGTQQQSITAYISAVGTTLTDSDNPSVAWSTPTSGNLLLLCLAVDKASGAITTPTGWTIWPDTTAKTTGDVSAAAYFKVSDGTESSISISWTTSQGAQAWMGEYSGLSVADEGAEDDSGASSVSSQTSGTTAATSVADARAFAFWGSDTGDNTTATPTYDGYTAIVNMGSNVGGWPGCIVAELDLSATGAQESTYTTSGGDQMFGKIAVFNNGGGTTTQLLSQLGTMGMDTVSGGFR